ncbi:MAG: hypothetical protein HZA91_20900 [Verrucomicrobia bacterium]|nr:hypothetical protein [Verrucomicrobiota bacterium]
MLPLPEVDGPWLRTWCVALVLAVAALVGYEQLWRSRGFEPDVRDRAELWALQRERAIRAGRGAVVIIGTSRALLGLDPKVMEEVIPERKFFQLAIRGSSPVPVFRDFAADPAFVGDLICELHPMTIFGPHPAEAQPVQWLEFCRHRAWVSDIETWLRIQFQQRLVLEVMEVTPTSLLRNLVEKRRLPVPGGYRLRPDRFMLFEAARVDADRGEAHWLKGLRAMGPPIGEAELARRCEELERCVQRLKARGGRVVFLRMVSSGALYEAEAQAWPRARYWDVLSRSVSMPAVHFKDVPELAGIQCGEGSHLEHRDAQRFTRAFAAELRKRGLFP